MSFPLQPQFEALEVQRRAVEARIESLGEAQRIWKSEPGDWSALQIVEHLVLGDETVGSRTWSARKMGAKTGAPRFYATRFAFILLALRNQVQLPLPSPEFEPCGHASWPELAARWQNARYDLQIWLESPEFDAGARPFFHTIAGALTTRDLLELSAVHNAYHARRLARLVS